MTNEGSSFPDLTVGAITLRPSGPRGRSENPASPLACRIGDQRCPKLAMETNFTGQVWNFAELFGTVVPTQVAA